MIKTLLIINKYGGNINFEAFINEINDINCLNDLSVLMNLGVIIKTYINNNIYYLCKEKEFIELLNKFTTLIEIKYNENDTFEQLRVPKSELQFIKNTALKFYNENGIYKFLITDKFYKIFTENYRKVKI